MDIRKHVAKLPQRQDSLADQLADLLTAGNRLGLYDAVDLVRKLIDDKTLPKVSSWVCCGIQYPLTAYRCTKCGGYTTR